MSAVVILGIDPGTRCGWAVRRADGSSDSGAWDLRPRRFEGGGMRFLRLRSFLSEALDLAKPDLVAFEEVRRHLGVDAAHVYGGIVAVVSEECEKRGIAYAGVPVARIKRFATGKGNADKAAVLAAARAKWGRVESEDEADALWIAEVAAAEVAC